MGYRSTIIIGVNKKYEKDLKALNKNSMFKKVDQSFNEARSLSMVIYRGEYLKWYDSFEEVNAINKYILHLIEEDDENAFIVGIGEDGNVHTEHGHYYDFVGIFTTHEIYGEND